MPIPKKLDLNECELSIRNPNGTDSADLNQNSANCSPMYFDGVSFLVPFEKNQTHFAVTKLNSVHNDLFFYQPNNYDEICGAIIATSRCLDDQ